MQRRAEAGFSRFPFIIYLFPSRLFAITEEEEGRGGKSLSRFNSRLKSWIALDRRERIWRACEKFSSRSRLYLRATLHRSMNSPRLTFPSLPPHPFFARYISCLFKLRSQSELYDWLWFFFFPTFLSLRTGWE